MHAAARKADPDPNLLRRYFNRSSRAKIYIACWRLVVKGLADRLEGLGFARSDQAAVGRLEDRITSLVDRLDTSNARLNHLETIEHALADLLENLELHRQQDVERAAAAPSPEVTSLRADVQQTRSSLETVQGALEHLVDRLAVIEHDIRGASPAPATDMANLPERHENALAPPVHLRSSRPACASRLFFAAAFHRTDTKCFLRLLFAAAVRHCSRPWPGYTARHCYQRLAFSLATRGHTVFCQRPIRRNAARHPHRHPR